MSFQAILLPLFVEVFLTFFLLFRSGAVRVAAIKRGEVQIRDIALGQAAPWPAQAQQGINAYHNQFQLPVLFYVLTILAMLTRHADLLFVVVAWIFVVTRVVHAGIHVTSNYVPHRFNIFLVGAVVLLAMWIIFAIRIVLLLG